MLGILLLSATTLEACTPAPQDAAMRSAEPASITTADGASGAAAESQTGAVPIAGVASSPGQGARDQEQAALGPIAQPVAAENPLPASLKDGPAEALGRRTLSTAFVQVGPDGTMTVELRDGRVLVLRDVVMRARHYDGVQVIGGSPRNRYRGAYADVAAARPGGEAAPDESQRALVNAVEAERSPSGSR